MNSNTAIYDRTVDRVALIRLYERRLSDKVIVVIDDHAVRVDKLISDAKGSEAGFRRLRDLIDADIKKTYKEVYTISKASLLDFVTDQISYTYQSIENVMSKIWRTQQPTRRVAEELVLEKPLIKDQTLALGWAGVAESERKRIEQIIRKGVAEGKTINDIALEVRKGNVFNISKNQSQALVTTAVTSIQAQADHAVYKANEKALYGWQYVAILDSRTTPLCRHRDGQIYSIGQTQYLPPSHFRCRSSTVPVFKSWADIANLEGAAEVRRRNISKLSKDDLAFYDGQTPMRETYDQWLRRQPYEVKLRHLGDYTKVNLFDAGQIPLEKFDTLEGKSAGLRDLRQLTQPVIPGETARFAAAKQRLDSMQLGASTPDDLIGDVKMTNTLRDYYLLQAGELDGTLSLTNYRGILIGNKRAQKNRVLNNLPTEEQLVFNPVTNRYEDIRLYQPSPSILQNNLRLVRESEVLKEQDKIYLENFINSLEDKMSVNERAVVLDNLRILFSRYRKNPEVWQNFKAVSQAQIKFDVINFSDAIETQLRYDADVIKKLKQTSYIDPVLGPIQLDDLYDTFIDTILAKNKWEDRYAPKLARDLAGIFNLSALGIPKKVWIRLSDRQLQQFFLKFAHRLSMADGPDFDSFAVSLGRDLYNLANLNGTRNEWFNTGKIILENPRAKSLYELETFGVQKRRMKSRMSGQYFGPYYDTFSRNIRITDPKILEYAKLSRKIDVAIRLGVKDPKNKLIIRPGFKTYFIDRGVLGYTDTRIPIISTSSYSDFPAEFVDKDLSDALNWMASSRYKIDTQFYDFIDNLLFFKDDKGKAEYFDNLNEYRKFMVSRGDAYERIKAMEWLRKTDSAFSNHVFIDHRARVYERGFIGVQSGETSTAS